MGNVALGPQFVRHGVVQAQERVGEGHAGDAGRVVHLLAGQRLSLIHI